MADLTKMQLVLNGLDTSLEELVQLYPDKAAKLLQSEARRLRKDVIKKVKERTNYNESSKMSLATTKAYNVSQPKGWGVNQSVDLSTKAPHFHLVENGHELYVHGEHVGWVQGKFMMRDASKEAEDNFQDSTDKMIKGLLKEAGLI